MRTIIRRISCALCVLVLGLSVLACKGAGTELVSKGQTFAELRTIKRGVTVRLPGEKERAPYARERLVDGETVRLRAGALAWLRRDGGATLLVSGPAELTLRVGSLEVSEGRVFVDTPPGASAVLTTPRGDLHLSAVRTSIDVAREGAVEAYVLRGGVRSHGGVHAGPGERLSIATDDKATKTPVTAWEDWTGGLATTDRSAEPAPYGIGTIGARKPSDRGQPRFPLAIQRLDVRVTIDGEFATTEVDEVFANPTAATVEGIYSFRTPLGATLARFGVDRDGVLMWGRVKEKQAAAAQYQANVYEGSLEDPALLEWDAPGVYKARLYPIGPRQSRRVLTRYSEWLGRHGPRGERRLYVYPMAAEGAEKNLPRIEELTVTLNLERARAREVRVGMNGKRAGSVITVKAYDLVPRADFAVELFDDAGSTLNAYRSSHKVDRSTTAADQIEKAEAAAKTEAPYILVPVRPKPAKELSDGLDLGIVVDTSAATDAASLAIARAMTGGLLAHLGPQDRVAVWAGDATLRAVSDGSDRFTSVDPQRREAIVTGLAQVERGGATDIGAILSEATSRLDVARRGAVVYIGDGQPTVGELGVIELRERLARLPRPVRVFGIGVGDDANLTLLSGITRGGFAARVADAHAAGRTALDVLEQAERPVLLGASVDLGPGIDRIYPREIGPLAVDESAFVIGRVVGSAPTRVVLRGTSGETSQPIALRVLDDGGDLRRRWAEGRLAQLIDEGAGRAAVVEVGVRSGIITPFTSLYVPTAAEHQREIEQANAIVSDDGAESWWRWFFASNRSYELASYMEVEAEQAADNKEGGTGTRARGEEGSMGKAAPRAGSPNARYAVKGPADNDAVAKDQRLREAAEFGMIGALSAGAAGDSASPPAQPSVDSLPAEEAQSSRGNMFGDAIGDAYGAGGLGLSGIGRGGGGDQTVAATAPTSRSTKSGVFGSGHGRLGGAHRTDAPKVRMGATQVQGRLPPEVIQRIVRQNYGRFRMCYERGLRANPSLAGRVVVGFTIARDGSVSSVSDAGSDLPDTGVVDCLTKSFYGMSFPQPEGGTVAVMYPIRLDPSASSVEAAAPSASWQRVMAQAVVGTIGHAATPCPLSANLPFEERRILWRERLVEVRGNVDAVIQRYYEALNGCEATTWRERYFLLILAVDVLDGVGPRVEFWRRFKVGPAADAIYRAIVTRARTPQDIRELHEALGIKELDRAVLAKALAEEKSPEERAKLLGGLARQWEDDLELHLMLLDALEDAGNDAAGRALARKLRRRSDATTRVRTAVGEYYLRLGAKENGAPAERDNVEGRRTFGEIVEFAPDDPWARRLLGDLLRAHGWYEEALRQYETLARLSPDDTSVPLLRAAASQGLGRTEEAIRWTEKAAQAGIPDATSTLSRTSRSLASAFLAWAREDAEHGGRKDEALRLRERARRLTAVDVPEPGSARLILTWAHPELHPELWSNALGSAMPASDGDAALGVAQVMLPRALTDGFVELHLQREDAERVARLGAEAVLTAILNEGTDAERIVRLSVPFTKVDGRVLEKRRFKLDGSSLREEVL